MGLDVVGGFEDERRKGGVGFVEVLWVMGDKDRDKVNSNLL